MENDNTGEAYVMVYIDKSSGNIGLAEDITFIVAKSKVTGKDNEQLIAHLSKNMMKFFEELYAYCRACRIHLAQHSGLPLVPNNFPDDALSAMTELTTEEIDSHVHDANAQAEVMNMDYHTLYPEPDDEEEF